MQLVQRLLADGHSHSLDVYEVADGLRKLGHAVTIRTALGGGGGNECLRNLRHSFLSCRMQGTAPLHQPHCACCAAGDSKVSHTCHQFTGFLCTGVHGQALYIVDPCFKEQFEIPHVNPRYTRIMSDVPVSFIGTEEQVIAIVELMSKEISHAFQQAGATLPPWRQAASMLSKWQPRKSEDLSLDAEVIDSRAPSLPTDLAPAHLRQLLAKGVNLPHLQRHSCIDPWLRPGGAHARISLDEPNQKGYTFGPSMSQKRGSVSSNVGPLIAQTAGMVASVQQSMSALGIRKAQGIPPLNASSHAVHLV